MEKYKLAIRFLKESHCLKRYYNDYQLANRKSISNKKFIELMKNNQKYASELYDYIGLYGIFNGWSINENYKKYWLNYYYKIKKFAKLIEILK